MIQAQANKKHQQHHQLPVYPANHKVGTRVPKGGSCCEKCEYLANEKKRLCGEDEFIGWNGGAQIPLPVDEYCCDFFEAAK